MERPSRPDPGYAPSYERYPRWFAVFVVLGAASIVPTAIVVASFLMGMQQCAR